MTDHPGTTPVRPEVSSDAGWRPIDEAGAAKRTLERILRDEDDASAQTVRSWLLTRDGAHLQIARNEHSDWNLIRVEDVPQLIADLMEIAALAPVPRSGITATGREADPGRPKEPPK